MKKTKTLDSKMELYEYELVLKLVNIKEDDNPNKVDRQFTVNAELERVAEVRKKLKLLLNE